MAKSKRKFPLNLVVILSIFLLLVFSIYSSKQYNGEGVKGIQSDSSLSSYSLSFAPIKNWWPTENNSFQQIDAALWKDSDYDNVKNFTDLKVEWKFDPNYYQMKDTASNYFSQCPIERVNNRPCIVFTVHVATLKPGNTDVQLMLKDSLGGNVWNSEPASIDDLSTNKLIPTQSVTGLSTYSLSFESEPIRKWWPLAANHSEDVTAALWKDSDGDNVSRFTNLSTEWQFDPKYISVVYTSSKYFDQCPVPTAGGRPCIYFYASVKPNMPGATSVKLTVKDQSGEEAWNAYPLIIEDISVGVSPTFMPTSIQVPQGNEYESLEQKVNMLEAAVSEQDVKLNQTQSVLDRIMLFLKNLFNFS